MTRKTNRLVDLCARRILENVALGRVYDPQTVRWANKVEDERVRVERETRGWVFRQDTRDLGMEWVFPLDGRHRQGTRD